MSDQPSRYTCAKDGCERGVRSGHALYRTSPKGELFQGRCEEHFDGEPEPVAQMIEDRNQGGYSMSETHERCDTCGVRNQPTERYRDAKGENRVGCVDERACSQRHHHLSPQERREVSEYRFDRIRWSEVKPDVS